MDESEGPFRDDLEENVEFHVDLESTDDGIFLPMTEEELMRMHEIGIPLGSEETESYNNLYPNNIYHHANVNTVEDLHDCPLSRNLSNESFISSTCSNINYPFNNYTHFAEDSAEHCDETTYLMNGESNINYGLLDNSCNSHIHDTQKKIKHKKLVLSPSNWISNFTSAWIFKLLIFLIKSDEVHANSFELDKNEKAKLNGDVLFHLYKELREPTSNDRKEPVLSILTTKILRYIGLYDENTEYHSKPLLRALKKAYMRKFLFLAIWKIFWAIFTWFSSYWLLKWIINTQEQLSSPNIPSDIPLFIQGYEYSFLLFVCIILGGLCLHHFQVQSLRIGIHFRAALNVLIYRKALKLLIIRGGIANVVNMVANDCNRISEAIVTWHYLWSAGFECLIVSSLVLWDIGIAAIPATFMILFIILPLQFYLSIVNAYSHDITTKMFIKRVNLMSDIIVVIKLIKCYALEQFYYSKIEAKREKEIKELRKALSARAMLFTVVFVAPVFLLFICITMCHFQGLDIYSTTSIFSLLSLFNTLRYPLLTLPTSIRTMYNAQSSLNILDTFLELPEVYKVPSVSKPPVRFPTLRIRIRHADFIWHDEQDEHTHLTNISLDLHSKQMIVIVGDVNSAKSLLAATLGQLILDKGTVYRYGKLGYVPQEPWLLENSSIRDNILFGSDFDETLYKETIRYAGLVRDFMVFENGDETIISDVTLTNLQKQRISLARCLFHQPDIIVLEDCLFDLDWKQAKKFFKECIKPLANNRLVLMAVQHNAILPYCDTIIVMKNGKIQDKGSYSDLKLRRVKLGTCLDTQNGLSNMPTGIFDQVDQLKLDSIHSGPSGIYLQTTPYLIKKQRKRIRSPLVTADVITVDYSETTSSTASLNETDQTLSNDKFSSNIDTYNDTISIASHDISDIDSTYSYDSQLSGSQASSKIGRHIGQNESEVNIPVHKLMNINMKSSNGNYLNENVISKLMERNPESIVNVSSSTSNRHISLGTSVEASDTAFDTDGTSPTRERIQLPITFYDSILAYLRENSGSSYGLLIVLFFIFVHGIRFYSDWWLSTLTNGFDDSNYSNIMVYGILLLLIFITVIFRNTILTFSLLGKSISLHDRVVRATLLAPIQFFDYTPLSDIMACYAKSLFVIDGVLPETILIVLSFFPIIIGTLILCCTSVPYILVMVPFVVIAAIYIMSTCIRLQDHLRDMELKSKAQIFTHLSTTLLGLFSIRTYKVQSLFDGFYRSILDADHKLLYARMLIKCAMCLLLDFVGAIFVLVLSLLLVRFEISPNKTGFALSNACQLMLFVQWFAKSTTEIYSSITAVPTVISFGNNAPQEDSCESIQNSSLDEELAYNDVINDMESSNHNGGVGDILINSSNENHHVINITDVLSKSKWPTKGDIEFKNVSLKYNPYGGTILRNVSFHIKAGERVGVIGRSGSGKSTLLSAILRLVELSEGSIHIDGINIRHVPLHLLRSHIAIIPQEPILLTGTIKENIDPYCTISDDEIWKVLDRVHLASKIKEMLPEGLSSYVAEASEVFTVTERQLLCIARAIIVNSKVVILDEPKEFLDTESEALVESVLDENFKDSTVLVLATRFRLIVQLSRIIVMERGKIKAFASPLELLDDPRSRFAKMVNQDSDGDPVLLRALAEQASRRREV